jgi:hypothetical protein
MASGLLLGCADPKPGETWDIRATPTACGTTLDLCIQYSVDGSEEVITLRQEIEGFDHDFGYSYRIEVETIDVDDPSTEWVEVRYELVEVIDQSATPELEFPLQLSVGTFEFVSGGGTIFPDYPFTCAQQTCDELAGWFNDFAYVYTVFRFGPEDQLFPLELVSSVVNDG